MKSGFRLSSQPFLSTYVLANRPAVWLAYNSICVQLQWEPHVSSVRGGHWLKRELKSILHDDRAAVCDTGNETELSKFLESCNVTLFLPSSYSKELRKTKTYWLSVLTSQNQSNPNKKKCGFFCTNYHLLLTLVYSLNVMQCDVDSSTAIPRASKVHASHQGLLLWTAPEWKKPTGLSELVSLHGTSI